MQLDFSTGAPSAVFSLRRRLEEQIAAYKTLCQADPAGANSTEEFAAQLRREAVGRPLPEPDKLTTWFPWEDWVEWGCMALAALVGWRIYRLIIAPLIDAMWWNGLAQVSVLIYPMLYLAVALPIFLVLGHKLGKWLVKHLVF